MIKNKEKEIKRELYKSYLILVRTLYKLSEPEKTTLELGIIRKRYLIGSTIFLAIAMESFINDFGDSFVNEFEHIEKMDPKTKYLLLPKLSKSNPAGIIKKHEASYEALVILFRFRNIFVHYKPAFRAANISDERLYADLRHDTVRQLYSEMIKILKLINTHFKMFDGGEDWISNYSEDISANV